MWIKTYIEQPHHETWVYLFYEHLASESLWFKKRFWAMIPKEYEERRKAQMLEF